MTDTFTPPAPLQTAVLFLVFNRPDTTAQVFEAIRKAKPPRLYVAADGPRANREGEAEKCAKVREITTAVDWPCEVKTLFREENLGCKYAVSGGITWFFEHEEQGIILEDDCLPSQSFFWFCEYALNKYATDERVGMVAGRNDFGVYPSQKSGSHFFSSRGFIWGWAAWRRSVKSNYLENAQKGYGIYVELFRTSTSWVELVYRIGNVLSIRSGKVNSWGYPWNISHLIDGQRCVIPKKNRIRNIGMGLDATHTSAGKPDLVGFYDDQFDLTLNDYIEDNKFSKITITNSNGGSLRLLVNFFLLILKNLKYIGGSVDAKRL